VNSNGIGRLDWHAVARPAGGSGGHVLRDRYRLPKSFQDYQVGRLFTFGFGVCLARARVVRSA
jgi:hypothetical protein